MISRYDLTKGLAIPFVAVCAALLMGACAQAVKTAEPEPEPEPVPPPGITGTWSWTPHPFEEDGETLTEHMLLTFVDGRFIEAWEVRNAAGERVDDWFNEGGWSATDTTIEKRWYDDYDDGHGSVTKQYYWGDAKHNVLYVEYWPSDDLESHYVRLTRVPDALPDLTGTWTYFNMYDDYQWRVTFDGETVVVAWQPSGSDLYNVVTGTGTLDPATYFIELTGLTRVADEEGATAEPFWGDGVGRLALAPAHNGGIRVSPFWEEPPIRDQIVEEEEDAPPRPYGHYWLLFERQPVEE